jgi:predicted extracellular nuclease
MRLLILTIALTIASCGTQSSGDDSGSRADGPTAVSIHDIQGAGQASSLDGSVVSVTGIVTGDFQNGDADVSRDLGGFFVQAAAPDSNPATSEGLFVFAGERTLPDVNVGDRVRVVGTVTEFHGETQIAASRVTVTGSGAVQPVDLELPAESLTRNSDGQLIADLERFEGMLIRLPQVMTVGNLYRLERFGEITLTQGGRQFSFTHRNPPDVGGYSEHRAAIAARTLLLDDGRRRANAAPVAYLSAGDVPGYSLRVGDEVAGLVGNLRYSRGSGPAGTEAFRLMPVVDVIFESRNPRPAVPAVDGDLKIAYFNALNFFSSLDDGSDTCGPGEGAGCRGADTAAEFDRQSAKLVTALRLLDADIFGLVEVENDGGESLRLLVEDLNRADGRAYEHVQTGVIGTDSVTTGLVYDTASVAVVGQPAILDSSADPRFNTRRNRPAIAQTFRQLDNGALFTVVINHLKSKGSSCADLGDPDIGDGQGNCNQTRTRAAAALADWVARDPTGSADDDVLLLGDFNAYVFEDPLAVLKDAGFLNLLEDRVGEQAYSYTYDAQAGALDHAFASPSLVAQVSGVAAWHINADEPAVRDYNLDANRDPGLFDPATPYRSSDHDPLIIGLKLSE